MSATATLEKPTTESTKESAVEPLMPDRFYEQFVQRLPISDRLALATRILNEIPSNIIVDYDDEWTDEARHEWSNASLRYFESQYPEEEELV